MLTLLDAPGHPDFVGEVRAGLRAADAALFVVSAADGADAQSRSLWHECALVGMPRAVVVTQLDAREADFEATLADCRAHFGAGVQPLGVPVAGSEGAVSSIADLLLGEVHDYAGGRRTVRPAGPEHADAFDTHRPGLIEGIIEESEDGALMDRYLEGEELDFATLERDLLTAVAHGTFHPVLPVSAETGAGVGVLLHLVEAGFPHPGLHALPTVTGPGGGAPVAITADPDGPLVAEVVHTRSDAYVGHLSLVRVFSGRLRTDRPVHVSGHLELLGVPDRRGPRRPRRRRAPRRRRGPLDGELLTEVRGHRGRDRRRHQARDRADVRHALLARRRRSSSPRGRCRRRCCPPRWPRRSRADEDRMPVAFRELAAEDPSLRIEHDAGTGQVVLWTTGPAHLDLVLSRLRSRFNVGVEQVPVQVAMRETATERAEAQGRHVKQSGGHGQFAVCHLVIEPLPRGTGSSSPRRSSAAPSRASSSAASRRASTPSSRRASSRAGRWSTSGSPSPTARPTRSTPPTSPSRPPPASRCASSRRPRPLSLLEPVDTVVVTVDDEYLGAVMTDIGTRRGQIVGSAPSEDEAGRSVLEAAVPQLELIDYAVALRSLAHGTGTFHREHRGYEPLPERLAREHLPAS